MTSAAGVRAKLARSLEHLQTFDSLMHQYLDTDPVELQRQIQPDGQTSVFALKVTVKPPVELAVLVGEVVYQLRSALDHIANQLVRSAGNSPTKRTTFPVLTTCPEKPITIHGGVNPTALAIIEELQPYQRQHQPGKHPLAVLNELWNTDKHRNLSLTTTMLADSRIFIVEPGGRAAVGGQFQRGPLADNDIVGVFRFEGAGPPPGAEVHASGQTFVAFADSGPWGTDRPVIEILEELHRHVFLTVLPRLEPSIELRRATRS